MIAAEHCAGLNERTRLMLLLFDQFFRLRSPGLLVLASGYLFEALIIVSHTLSFPGAFAAAGLLGAGPQTTA